MVQLWNLPALPNAGTQIGGALGEGLGKGMESGINRGMLQSAIGGLKNLPKDASPFDLASSLLQATAGIPEGARAASALFPLLLQQMQSKEGLKPPGQAGQPPSASFPGGVPQGAPGAPGVGAQGQPIPSPGGEAGGILGTIIPQDEIAQRAIEYGRNTGLGIPGAEQMSNYLKGLNDTAAKQRLAAEQKAADVGVPADQIPLFMQIGQRYKDSKTLDDWVRSTNKDFKEYKNLTKSLADASYPGLVQGLTEQVSRGFEGKNPPETRESRLGELDRTVRRLKDMGFEQEVRETLAQKGLSPTEIEERLHPFTPEQKQALASFPPAKGPKSQERLVDFLRKNVTNDTSLLALRHQLWQEKGYDWKDIAAAMQEALGDNLTLAQLNELGILEREPPRQSLTSIFRGWEGVKRALEGQK
jgi:hypothetical protein